MARRLHFRAHAVGRMLERDISEQNVRAVVERGEAIERYPADAPFPSRLILGWVGDRPLHVVAADDPASDITMVITVYQPDPVLWEHGYRSRRP